MFESRTSRWPMAWTSLRSSYVHFHKGIFLLPRLPPKLNYKALLSRSCNGSWWRAYSHSLCCSQLVASPTPVTYAFEVVDERKMNKRESCPKGWTLPPGSHRPSWSPPPEPSRCQTRWNSKPLLTPNGFCTILNLEIPHSAIGKTCTLWIPLPKSLRNSVFHTFMRMVAISPSRVTRLGAVLPYRRCIITSPLLDRVGSS
jgi:hypothetical protein